MSVTKTSIDEYLAGRLPAFTLLHLLREEGSWLDALEYFKELDKDHQNRHSRLRDLLSRTYDECEMPLDLTTQIGRVLNAGDTL